VGAVIGGAVLGGFTAVASRAVSSVPAGPRWLAAAAVAAVLVLLDAGHRLPAWRRQVDVRWLSEYRGWVVGLGYGVQLGAAVFTVVPTAATWVMLVVAVASASPAVALCICLAFAVVRALPVLALRRVSTVESLRGVHHRLAALAAPVDRTTRTFTGVAVAVMAVAGGLG
jgi:hypothetical protein